MTINILSFNYLKLKLNYNIKNICIYMAVAFLYSWIEINECGKSLKQLLLF